jgi:transcriptional regulator with XRE-family HTH domain
MSRTKKPYTGDRAVGAKLSLARAAAGLTQKQAGQRLGLTWSAIWTWEKGRVRPSPDRLIAIAKLYNTTPRALGYEAWLQARRVQLDPVLATNLRLAREAAGLTLKEVSQQLGTTKQTVWNWENCCHRPSRNQLIAVAKLCLGQARQRAIDTQKHARKAATHAAVLLKMADG